MERTLADDVASMLDARINHTSHIHDIPCARLYACLPIQRGGFRSCKRCCRRADAGSRSGT